MIEATSELLLTLSSCDEILFDDDLREDADATYYSSKTGLRTIISRSVAYFPPKEVACPSKLDPLQKFAEEIARETDWLQDELLAEQLDSNGQLSG